MSDIYGKVEIYDENRILRLGYDPQAVFHQSISICIEDKDENQELCFFLDSNSARYLSNMLLSATDSIDRKTESNSSKITPRVWSWKEKPQVAKAPAFEDPKEFILDAFKTKAMLDVSYGCAHLYGYSNEEFVAALDALVADNRIKTINREVMTKYHGQDRIVTICLALPKEN